MPPPQVVAENDYLVMARLILAGRKYRPNMGGTPSSGSSSAERRAPMLSKLRF